MAILKKTLFKRDLAKVNTLILDKDPNSIYFKVTDLSDTFSGGKNSFLIQGSPYLVNGTEVKIEIIDALGNTIYYEPAKGNPEPYEGVAKPIAVHIYPDTAFGPCTITILGELSDYVDQNGSIVPVPDNWKDSYNLKWQKIINVNPNLPNTTKIRFYKIPKVKITEEILPIYNRTPDIKIVSASIDGYAINPIPGDDFTNFNGFVNYQLRITDNGIFSQSMEGGTINVVGLNQPYTTSLIDVITSKAANVNIPYYETSSVNPNVKIVKEFQSASFTSSFEFGSIVKDSNINSSFATIKLTDLETFTGDVHRVKVYGKSLNTLGDFQLLEDVQLESNDLLIKKEFSSSLNVRTGIFTEPIINSYWKTGSINTTVNWIVDDSLLTKSVKLIPLVDSNNTNGLFYFSTSQSLNFTKDTEYQLDFTPLLSASADGNGIIDVYLTGSSFVDTDINFGYGKKLLSLETKNKFRRYDKQQINFIADNNGTGELLFLVKSGIWQLSDVSLSTASETSFSPNEVTLTVNVPNKINQEKFEFKFEFYDINNNYVPIELKKEYTFTGGNDLVANKDIILTLTNNSFAFAADNVAAFPQFINFNIQTTAITGALSFYSSAFDITGGLIPTNLTPYPGLLTKIDDNNYRLTSQSFSGSLSQYLVGAITYTASADGVNRYATVYRLNEGKVGKTGPGVVYRGEWSASADYIATDLRRDVVLGKFWNGASLEDRYYICSVSHTSAITQRPSDDNTGNSVGNTWKSLWTSFSVEFDSVATDILFSQDVYANRTVNVGTRGGNPVIALYADYPDYKNPSIKISSSRYGDSGIFMGFDSGSPKLSLRGGNNALLWDGASLIISGTILATNGKIAGWIIDQNSLRDENRKIELNPITPSIAILNDNKKRLDIRSGQLTQYDSTGATLDIDPPGVNISLPTSIINGPASINHFGVSSTPSTITIAANNPLSYTGQIVWQSINLLTNPTPFGIARSDDNFSGYIEFIRGIEIRESVTDNLVTAIYANSLALSGPLQEFKDGTYAKNVNITFPSAGTYNVKEFYEFNGYFTPAEFDQPTTLNFNNFNWEQPSFTVEANTTLNEFTDEGLQILKNSQKYFRIKRDDTDVLDGKDISARIAGRVILDGIDSSNDVLVIPKGNIRLDDGTIKLSSGGSVTITNLITNTLTSTTITSPTINSTTVNWGAASLTQKSGRPTLFIPNMLRTSDVSTPGLNPLVDLQWVQSGADTGYVVRRTSSKKYKKNIENWNKQVLDKISNLPVRVYNFKNQPDGDKKLVGIIAEELNQIGLEEFVGIYEGEIDNIATSDLVFVLWKGIQELSQKVKTLESKISSSIT